MSFRPALEARNLLSTQSDRPRHEATIRRAAAREADPRAPYGFRDIGLASDVCEKGARAMASP